MSIEHFYINFATIKVLDYAHYNLKKNKQFNCNNPLQKEKAEKERTIKMYYFKRSQK